MRQPTKSLLALFAGVAVLAAGCGGGGSGSASAPAPAPEPAAAQILGTAAVGAALAHATVAITDSAGAWPCVEAAVTTGADGSYACTLKAGETAPFFVVVTDPSGDLPPMVSVSTDTPAAGAKLTLNVTPLTTAIVAQLSASGNALDVVTAGAVDAAKLAAITSNVVAQLQPVLDAISMPAGYDPFTTSITAAVPGSAGNTADLVLDVVKVGTDPATGQLALTTIDNPTPVLLATATSAGSNLGAPTTGVSTLSQAGQLAAQALNKCLAVPLASRVLGTDTSIPASQGGPDITDATPECGQIVAEIDNGAGLDFLHNGYGAGQFFYGMLTNDTMTGAQFAVPEIVAFYPGNANAAPGAFEAYDRAILNFRFLDAKGDPGNFITMAARLPGTSSTARPTDWWLTGNQQVVDANVRLMVRRNEQLNTAAATGSFFNSGMQFLINAQGPGSVLNGAALAKARITGPGLPAGGVVFKVSADAAQANMDLWNKTGSLANGKACGNNTTTNCPLLWFERTAGTSGADATTLATNPTGMLWAQPADNVDPTLFVRGAQYTIELFYGANTGTADRVVKKTLLSDLVRATRAVNLPWNAPGTQTLAAFDPTGSLAAAQTALTVDWVQNVSAQQIGSVTPMVDTTNQVWGANQPVPRGATSVVLNGQTVPAFDAATTRGLMFGYRMLDGSHKTMVYRYN